MARISHALDFQHPQHIQIDRKHSQVDDDDLNVLDDAILDHDITDMSPGQRRRRESFADSTAAFSPSEAHWSTYQFTHDNVNFNPNNSPAHHFLSHPDNAFPDPSPVHNPAFSSQQTSWPVAESSGSSTPTANHDSMVTDYESRGPALYSQPLIHTPHNPSYEPLQPATAHTFVPPTGFSSPSQPSKDWLSTSPTDSVDFRSISAQPRIDSPPFSPNTSLLRRDGIRKKNARFEIPAERNLRTIDQLINQTSDEQEIKELKQQKRLLRNRQAALDSRQRKKQHTERLEDEKKHYTVVISDLEDALGEMRVHEADWLRAKDNWTASQQQYQQYIDALVMEKEELVRCHTIESGELRKKNAILMDQIQRMENTAMSTAPSSTGFSADYSDFDHLTMNSSPWDDFSSLPQEFNLEAEPMSDVSTSVDSRQEKQTTKEDDRATTPGLLLMLLLCGAWMASRSSVTSTNLLPEMPEDVRVASATVLQHIYQGSGVELCNPPSADLDVSATAKEDSITTAPKTTLSAFEMASLSRSPLDVLHHQLTTPSKEQLREQAFSLSPGQYNDLSSDGSYGHQTSLVTNVRRNIGETMATVPTTHEGSAAETYTRSLMWDKIPKQVLKDFARMVADSGAEGGRWKTEPLS